jgi:hypothetical protein
MQMDATVLIAVVIGAGLLLVLSFVFAGMPFVWYVSGAVLLYKGLTVAGVACLAVGVLIHAFRRWRKVRR